MNTMNTMNQPLRIEKLFASENKGRIAFITAGDGGIKKTHAFAMALIDGGVNMLEIGIPFSDPVADGPVIQRASQRAIAAGTTLQDVLWLVQEIRRQSDIPLVLFSYLNPILAGIISNPDFLKDAKSAGVDGLLLVDCPIEESESIRGACLKNQIALIYVITPSTPLARIQRISTYAEGFLYYACQKGTTGLRNGLPEGFHEKIASIKALVSLPVVVGFGVSNQEMARAICQVVDGVVVGSLFVQAIENGTSVSELTKLAREIYALEPQVEN